MPDRARTCLIALAYGTNLQRHAVQTIVEAHSGNWWHQLPDLWIADGHSAVYWRNLVAPTISVGAAKVIVFELPEGSGGDRLWAGHGTREEFQWLHTQYSKTGLPPLPLLPASDDEDEGEGEDGPPF